MPGPGCFLPTGCQECAAWGYRERTAACITTQLRPHPGEQFLRAGVQLLQSRAGNSNWGRLAGDQRGSQALLVILGLG